MKELNAADILAAVDVVDGVAEESDSMEFERAADMRLALLTLKSTVASAIGLIETQMINRLEDAPRRYGDKTYEVVDDGVYRAEHGKILDQAQKVAKRRAVNPDTGEVNVAKALEEFAYITQTLYVAPSTAAKVGGIEGIGLDKRKVRRWEKKGRKLSVVEHHQEFS